VFLLATARRLSHEVMNIPGTTVLTEHNLKEEQTYLFTKHIPN